jgi:plasmid stabilization system protein ParE
VKVYWAPIAEEQVASAFGYIAADRPEATVDWFERLVQQVESLSTLPDLGRMVPEAQRESIRELLVDPYRVIYRRDEDAIMILTVQHQRRDLHVDEVE